MADAAPPAQPAPAPRPPASLPAAGAGPRRPLRARPRLPPNKAPHAAAALLVQALLLALAATGFFAATGAATAFYALHAALLAAYLYALFFRLLPALPAPDRRGYAVFFLGLAALLEAALVLGWLAQGPLEKLRAFSFLVVGAALFLAAFEVFFKRSHTQGTVLFSGHGMAAVRVPFDLLASVAGGDYVVEALDLPPAGARVRLTVQRSWFKRVPARVERVLSLPPQRP